MSTFTSIYKKSFLYIRRFLSFIHFYHSSPNCIFLQKKDTLSGMEVSRLRDRIERRPTRNKPLQNINEFDPEHVNLDLETEFAEEFHMDELMDLPKQPQRKEKQQ